MIDQADRLRNIVSTREIVIPEKLNSRVIAVTSGKGGVGKTNFSVNLAVFLRKQNKRVIVFDTDFGLANVEILFGVFPKYNLADVLVNDKPITDVLTEGPLGIKFISAGSGQKELVNITDKQTARLIESMAVLDEMADIIIIDTGAGASNAVVDFIKVANEAIIVTTPEPTSVTDAYALIKTLRDGGKNADDAWSGPELKMVLNRVENAEEGDEVFSKLSRVSQRFLNVEIKYLGCVLDDSYLVKAVKKQQPAIVAFPNSAFAKSIEAIGLKLLDIPAEKQTNLKSFVKRLTGIFGGNR
jgi:flagellar biosynthesis protein FlhG